MSDFSFKELMCSLISVAVLGAALLLIHCMFYLAMPAAFNAEAYQRHSQLLNILMGMAGSVIGYYFGRLPAEKLAQSAQAAATKAATETGQKTQSLDELKKRVDQVKSDMQAPLGGRGGADPTQRIEIAIQRLDDALR